MPFVSEAQRRYLYAVKPAVAAKFAAHERPRYGRKRKLKRRKKP